MTSDQNLLSSGFESGSQNMLEQYSKNFKIYTESMVSGWLNNLNLNTMENPCGDHISESNLKLKILVSNRKLNNFKKIISASQIESHHSEIFTPYEQVRILV